MNIFGDVCRALQEKRDVALATIIAASGSTPAPAESRMIVYPGEKFRSVGTIGGGCLDQSILHAARNDFDQRRARILTFNLNDDLGDTGLSCGGKLEVLLECLTPAMLPVYRRIVDGWKSGQDCILVTTASNDGGARKAVFDIEGNILEGDAFPELTLATVREWVPSIRATGVGRHLSSESEDVIIELIPAAPPLIIFGGGHVGKVVSRCAALVGFRVTVVDDRRAFANKERFPEAENTLCEAFDMAFQRLPITSSTYVVIATRGHRHDEIVLEKVLQYGTKYVGMIGSRRKILIALDRLRGLGVSEDSLSKVHAPIGLNIGARTAEEIGISIAAELIAVRRQSHFAVNPGNRLAEGMRVSDKQSEYSHSKGDARRR